MAQAFLPNPDNLPIVDHINHNPVDNRLENLKWASQSENKYNTRGYSRSGYKGICWIKASKKWRAQIRHNHITYRLGLFNSPEAASEAYKAKAHELGIEILCTEICLAQQRAVFNSPPSTNLRELTIDEQLIFVGDDSRVYNHKMREFTQLQNGNYFNVTIGRKTIRVHRLVALAFLPNPDDLPMVDHINHDPLDNRLENLRWSTATQN